LIAARREQPANDLLTNLVQAEVDGEQLSDFEIAEVRMLAGMTETEQSGAFRILQRMIHSLRTATVAVSRLRRPRGVSRVGSIFPTGASAGLVT